MNPSYDSPFGSQNPGGQTGMPGGMFPNAQMPGNQMSNVQFPNAQMPGNQMSNVQFPNAQMPNNQMLNNQMPASNGYFPNQPTVSSSSQGDIILNPGKPNKKLPVILAIVVALIAIVAIVVMSIINLNKPSASPTGVSTDAKAAFSRFANFITTGTEGDTFPTEEYDSYTYYSLIGALDSNNNEYFTRANQLFEDSINQISKAFSNNLDNDAVEDYKTIWQLIYTYATNRLCDNERILEYYLGSGHNATNQLIDEEQQLMTSIKNDDANEIAEMCYAYEKFALSQYSKYSESGCIKEGKIDNECIASINITEEELSNIGDKNKLPNEAKKIAKAAARLFIQDLWTKWEGIKDE